MVMAYTENYQMVGNSLFDMLSDSAQGVWRNAKIGGDMLDRNCFRDLSVADQVYIPFFSR